MMDLTELALQPLVLMMGQERARSQFMADLDKRRTLQNTSRMDKAKYEQEEFERRVAHGEKGKGGNPLRPRIAQASEYMVNALMRDAAIAQYDARVQGLKSRTTPDSPAWMQQAVLP